MNRLTFRLILCLFALRFLSACGPAKETATPTLSLEAISTYAFQTFTAEMATNIALTPPTTAPSPAVSPSPFPPFAPPLPLPSISFASSTPLTGGGDCDNSAWIADVTIPDLTQLNPGQKFVKTWLVQNTGTCSWSTSYKVSFIEGLDMSGTDSYVPLSVPAGQQFEMSVSMRAPSSPGQYYGQWMMYNANNKSFGSFLNIVIKVE